MVHSQKACAPLVALRFIEQSACVVRIFKTIEISVLVEGNRYRYSSNEHLTGFLKNKLSLLELTPELLTQIYSIETMRFEDIIRGFPVHGHKPIPRQHVLNIIGIK